jgi:hypothetical protein
VSQRLSKSPLFSEQEKASKFVPYKILKILEQFTVIYSYFTEIISFGVPRYNFRLQIHWTLLRNHGVYWMSSHRSQVRPIACQADWEELLVLGTGDNILFVQRAREALGKMGIQLDIQSTVLILGSSMYLL